MSSPDSQEVARQEERALSSVSSAPDLESEGLVPPRGAPETFWSNAIRSEDLKAGDHIYVYRGPIQHHGIVTTLCGPSGHVMVAHFESRWDEVRETTLPDFLKREGPGYLRRAQYNEGSFNQTVKYGASYPDEPLPAEEVVRRAKDAVVFTGAWSSYHVLTNNCETFAFYCKTGKRTTLSRQAKRGLVAATVLGCAGTGFALAAAGVGTTATFASTVARARTVERAVKRLKPAWEVGTALVALGTSAICTVDTLGALWSGPAAARERTVLATERNQVIAPLQPLALLGSSLAHA